MECGSDPSTGAQRAWVRPRPRPRPKGSGCRQRSVRASVEYVFAYQKNRFGLLIRTVGLARAEAKPTLANLAYNFDRLIFHEQRLAKG